LERVDSLAGNGRLVAQELHELGGERTQQIGLEAGEGGDDPAAPPMAGETIHCFSMVAQRPYSCIAWTSRSISSRLPELTADLPSRCTCSISFSAFALS